MAHTLEMTERNLAGRRLRALLLTTAMVSVGAALAATQPAFAADAAAPAASTGLEEITVTARRTEENLQNVPVSASVLSSATISQQNLGNFQDLRGAVPDLQVTPIQGGIGTNIAIRGVGQSSFQVNQDPKTGLYVDEMYVARPEGNSLSFYDLSSVQVLYGPQGTLFGRNTTGGALLVTTARPSANGSSYAQVRYGNYNRIDTEAGVNIPITDNLFTRFSFRTENADGYITHLLDSGTNDNLNDKSFRGQVRWIATDKLTADLLYEHDESKTNGSSISVLTGCTDTGSYTPNYAALHTTSYCNTYKPLGQKYEVYGGAIYTSPTSALQTIKNGVTYTGGDYNAAGTTAYGHFGPFNNIYDNSINLRLNYQLTPDINLKSITINRQSRAQIYNPTVDAPNDIYQELDNSPTQETTEEVNLTGKLFQNRLNFVVGAFYYDQFSKFNQVSGTDWVDPTGYYDLETNHEKSYAGYGQVSFNVTSKLELTAGGRYTSDSKTATANINYAGLVTASPPAICGATYSFTALFLGGAACNSTLLASGSKSWSSFDPMGSVRYKFTSDISGYFTIRSAYNEGGFNSHAPPVKPGFTGSILSYDPEHFVDYEGGIKSEFFDHTLRVDVDVYYEKFSSIQTTALITLGPGITTRSTANAATAHYDGFEGALDWAPIPDLLLKANGSYFEAAYDSIIAGVTSTSTKTQIVGVAAPAYTYSFSGNYTMHPYHASTLILSLDYKATAPTLSCPTSTAAAPATVYSCTVPAYGLLGGRLDFKMRPDSPWTVGFWGTNLTNQYWLLAKTVFNPNAPNMGISSDTPGTPREYGIVIRRTF